MEEIVLRFLIGGLIVSAFSLLGDLFEPKSFAGIFGAAPSVALATLALTISSKGRDYAATELRSTVLGATAFFFYAYALGRLLMKHDVSARSAGASLIALWLATAVGAWALLLA
ncbi:MAG TPA: DUF3147 family protein [Candidatus Binataceae bacterium]|nr:DUF3147 family protein [Candidatus Binataceae bacterium]